MSEDKIEKVQKSRLLPVAEVDGREFLVDIENRLFRDFTNPGEVIGMHSEQGRKMVKDMQDSAWKSYGLSTGKMKKAGGTKYDLLSRDRPPVTTAPRKPTTSGGRWEFQQFEIAASKQWSRMRWSRNGRLDLSQPVTAFVPAEAVRMPLRRSSN